MNFLSKYLDFIFEAVAKQEMRLYYSDGFRDILKRIGNKSSVAQALLSSENSHQVTDIYTLIDITDKNDTISLIQVNRITRNTTDLGEILPFNIAVKSMRSEFWNKGRTEMKIGRWVRRIFTVNKSELSDSKIEEFVNLYKSVIDGDDLTNFELVEGEDIRKWYYENSYEESRGQLGSSCMRHHSCQSFFDIYVKNTEVCKLLILKSTTKKDKIIGRALVWKLIDGGYYMDRIYTINDSDKLLFKDYARINKIENSYSDGSNDTIIVKLGDFTYEKYPYMDTFVVYNPTTKLLDHDDSLYPGQGYINLENTNGGFGPEDSVWSDWDEEYITRENAVYCNNVEGWLPKSSARYLEYIDDWAAPTDGVVFSTYNDSYFFEIDTVFSDLMNDYLYQDEETLIEIETSSKSKDFAVESRKDLYVVKDGIYLYRDNVIKDPYDGEYHFKDENIDGVRYEFYLKNKIKKEIDGEDSLREDLYNLLKNFNITEQISNELKNSIKSTDWGVDEKPNINDLFNALKGWLISDKFNPNGYYSLIKINSYCNNCIKFTNKDVDVDKFYNWIRYNGTGMLIISKIAYTFDYSLFQDEIYKRYIFINL